MFRNTVFVGFFALILLFPLASNSEAVQWDLLIQANVENSPLYSGERPIVSGIIVDHASKPVPKATVNIKSGSMSIYTTTSQSGEFLAELGKQDRIPGNYIVNITAETQEGKTGIASVQFQIKGELSPVAVSQEKISTPEAQKYLSANPDDFDKDPIGFMLYNYYQKLYQEYLEDEKLNEKLIQDKAIIDEKKEIENQYRIKAIEEFQPGMGIFSGPQYENYVNSLDEEVKDTVIKHLNFTRNLVQEAQDLRIEILKNGGTAKDAQLAYLEKISTSREMIENLDSLSENKRVDSNNNSTIINENSEILDASKVLENEAEPANSPIKVEVDGINVEVEYSESVFFVNVNGTILEFLINGTNVSLLNDK